MTSLFQTSASTRLKASPGVRGVPAAFLLDPTGVVPFEDSKDARCEKDIYTNQTMQKVMVSCFKTAITNLDPLLRSFL